MSIDIKRLKKQLTLQDHEKIIKNLAIPIVSKSNEYYTLKSMCHTKDENCKNNLTFYTDSFTFTCFSHSCLSGSDIFNLITVRKQLFDKSWTFIDSVNFVIDTLDLDIVALKRKKIKQNSQTFDWDRFLGRYLRHESIYSDTKIYDDNILNFFTKIYHQSFLDDNISIETMEQFEICFYPRNQQIVIPVRDDGMNLIGLHARNLIPDKIEMGLKYQPVKLLDGTQYNFPTSAVLYGLGQNANNIMKSKSVILVESPKGVLQLNDILECNIAVGLFGMNLSKYKRQLLLELGCENFYVALDRQYVKWYNEKEDTDEYREFISYINTINKIIDMLRGYGNIYVIYDKECEYLEYKDSSSDKGKEIWDILWEKKELVM